MRNKSIIFALFFLFCLSLIGCQSKGILVDTPQVSNSTVVESAETVTSSAKTVETQNVDGKLSMDQLVDAFKQSFSDPMYSFSYNKDKNAFVCIMLYQTGFETSKVIEMARNNKKAYDLYTQTTSNAQKLSLAMLAALLKNGHDASGNVIIDGDVDNEIIYAVSNGQVVIDKVNGIN